jgi:hypothetical protein
MSIAQAAHHARLTQVSRAEILAPAMIFLAAKNPTEQSIAGSNNAVSDTPYRVTGIGEHCGRSAFKAFEMQAMSFGNSRQRHERGEANGCSDR